MALSGTISSKYEGWTYRMYWTAVQSIANNTSTITIDHWLDCGKAYDLYISKRGNTCTVDGGEEKTFTSPAISTAGGESIKLGTTTHVVKHNDNGQKSCNVSGRFNIKATLAGEYKSYFAASGTITLDTIARASQPSCITWPEHTQNVGSFGDTISIHMNRKSSEFTHNVWFEFGSHIETIATNVGTGTTWTIPLTLMNLIPNSTSGSGTIYVDTYNGNTFVGTKYCGFTATVPASVKPTCAITVSDPTGHATTYGSYVKGLSKFQVTITPTLAYKSAIKTYSTTANGSKYTTNSFTTGVLNSYGTLTVSATVVDNRGRSGSASKNLGVINYTAPSITKLTVGRCDADGTANMQGEYIQVTFSAAVTALNNKNTAKYTLKYKRTAESEFSAVGLDSIKDTYTVTNHKYVFAADTGSSYDVEVSVEDNHASASRTTSASTAFTLMHFGADGTSIGLLKVAEKSGAVDVGGDIYLNGHALYGAHGMVDNRDANELPQWYMETYGRGSVWEFKKLASIGFTAPATTFAPVQTIIPWKDSSGGLPRQVTYEGKTCWTRVANSEEAWGAWFSDALIAYPVGSIYIAYNHTNPGTLFGGTWVRLTGGFLWASQASDTIGQTGGEKTHTLTVNELPEHTHGSVYSQNTDATKNLAWYTNSGDKLAYGTVATGGGQPHNNMPPYIQVSIWRRTA